MDRGAGLRLTRCLRVRGSPHFTDSSSNQENFSYNSVLTQQSGERERKGCTFRRATANTPLTSFLCQDWVQGRRFYSGGHTFGGVQERSSTAPGFHRSIGLRSIQLNRRTFFFAVYCDTPLREGRRMEWRRGPEYMGGAFLRFDIWKKWKRIV